jgi:hypothetical protein
MSALNNAENLVEGDYEKFMKTSTGHVVFVVMAIVTILYMRLMWVAITTKISNCVAWMCCCEDDDDDDDDDDGENSTNIDSSATSQTPMSPHGIELGSPISNCRMSQPMYQNDEFQGDNVYDAYDNTAPNPKYCEQGGDDGSDQYYINNNAPPIDSYAQPNYNSHRAQPQPMSRSIPQAQRNSIPVSSRRSQVPQRQSNIASDNTDSTYNPFNSTRAPRVHPSRMT